MEIMWRRFVYSMCLFIIKMPIIPRNTEYLKNAVWMCNEHIDLAIEWLTRLYSAVLPTALYTILNECESFIKIWGKFGSFLLVLFSFLFMQLTGIDLESAERTSTLLSCITSAQHTCFHFLR